MNLYSINGDFRIENDIFVWKLDSSYLNISKTNAILSKGYIIYGNSYVVDMDYFNKPNDPDYHIEDVSRFKNIIRSYKINQILK